MHMRIGISIYLSIYLSISGRVLHGVAAKVMNWYIEESEFEVQTRNYVHFGKCMNLPMGKIVSILFFYKNHFDKPNLSISICSYWSIYPVFVYLIILYNKY